MNESVLLNEAAADDRFKTLFNTITSTSEEMGKLVATKSGGKYDASAVGTILELVFETLLNNGQTAFVDDIKDINQGFARYRTAERSLDTVKNGIRQTKAAADKMKGMGGVPNKNLDPTNLNGQSSSKRGIPSANMDNRAEQLAEDYINAHLDMFENTPENIADIKAHILELQK